MSFGSGDFVKLFNDFGKTDTFDLIPAVRSPTGSCVDESGCDWEKATLCAFDQASTAVQVSFLACMDESHTGTANDAAKTCASASSLDFSKIEACLGSAKVEQLLQTASDTFNEALPGRTTIPHTFVNAEDVSPSYSTIKNALCKAGSSSSACDGKPMLGMHRITDMCEA